MLTVSATHLRNDLFSYLDKVEAGEIVVIQRNNQEIARIVPTALDNWRDKMTTRVHLLVSPDDLLQPLEDVWEEYV